jgi:hypothetical protein
VAHDETIKQQLGMPYGTARGKLLKKMLHHLASRLDQHRCFRCDKNITDWNTLSIDHTVDWLHSVDPVGLYFDVQSIKFSHHSCNSANKRSPVVSNRSNRLANEEKDYQLGMPQGTARGLLIKMLLFKMIRELGVNCCHRCGDEIDDWKKLSLDHVVNWLYSEDPIGTYFDVTNIAFSHQGCNSGHSRNAHARQNLPRLTGYIGVSCKPSRCVLTKPFQAQLKYKGKRYHLGQYATAEEAARVYDSKRIELSGSENGTNLHAGLLHHKI